MGWLGWSWEETRRCDVNVIIMALEGREDLLNVVFGDGKPIQRGKHKPMTADKFKTFAAAHNQLWKRRQTKNG